MIRLLILILLIVLDCSTAAYACPTIEGLVDFNCDGTLTIAAIGDSVVKGVGDLKFGNRGGYVLRLQKRFKQAKVVNLGKPGFTTDRLFALYKNVLNPKNPKKFGLKLKGADLLLIDAGRNDYFDTEDPVVSIRNLTRLVSLLRRRLGRGKGNVAPHIVLATLLPTTRGYQRPFIEGLNALFFEFSSDDLPIGLYLNQLPVEVISVDGIHPSSEGYQIIVELVIDTLTTTITDAMTALRPDIDQDGIYDKFEKTNFGTDASKKDSDDDSLSDGDEVFQYGTDPTKADTDDDGISDGDEIAQGTDPLGSSFPVLQ